MVMERTDLRASGTKLHAVLRSKMLSAFKPFDATHYGCRIIKRPERVHQYIKTPLGEFLPGTGCKTASEYHNPVLIAQSKP